MVNHRFHLVTISLISILLTGYLSYKVPNIRIIMLFLCCLLVIAGCAIIWKSTWSYQATAPVVGYSIIGFFGALSAWSYPWHVQRRRTHQEVLHGSHGFRCLLCWKYSGSSTYQIPDQSTALSRTLAWSHHLVSCLTPCNQTNQRSHASNWQRVKWPQGKFAKMNEPVAIYLVQAHPLLLPKKTMCLTGQWSEIIRSNLIWVIPAKELFPFPC